MHAKNSIALLLTLFITGLLFPSQDTRNATAFAALTPTATPFIPACALEAEAAEIAVPTEVAVQSTDEAATPVTDMTETPAPTPEEAVEEAVKFTEFEPFDLKFNPNEEKPFAVVMNFTLFMENELAVPLEIRKPQFELSIEGVEWGELASTDFQIGRMQGKATLGIVLQSLTIIRNATPEQLVVLDCIKAERPIDVVLTGTIDVYPEGEKRTITVEMAVEDLLFSEDDVLE